MIRRAPLLAALALTACAAHRPTPPATAAVIDQRIPPFASVPYEPFSREAAVAIALREWRLFGSPVDDDPPGTRPHPAPEDKPERQEGLWQRVGEYWWLGLATDQKEARWTGKHDESGQVFPADDDEAYAWSAAFVDYVMRIAGARNRFPYAIAHDIYIDAANDVTLHQANWAVIAQRPDAYAPQRGDLICTSRGRRTIRFDDLPARFAGHCDIVVATSPGSITVVGGNVDDAVTMKHVPVTPDGKLAGPDGTVLDSRYPWFVVLRVLYDTPTS